MNSLGFFNETFTNGYRSELLEIISLFAILSAILVIASKNPIVSVLFLIGLFLSIACYFFMIGLNFIALSYLLVYVGAVSILFLFILMLINVRISELLSNTSNSIALAIFIIIAFYFPLYPVLPYSIVSFNRDGDNIDDRCNSFWVYSNKLNDTYRSNLDNNLKVTYNSNSDNSGTINTESILDDSCEYLNQASVTILDDNSEIIKETFNSIYNNPNTILPATDFINLNYLVHNSYAEKIYFASSQIWDSNLAETSHITSIGNIMYTSYSIWLILTSIILLLAMVGAIVITIKQK